MVKLALGRERAKIEIALRVIKSLLMGCPANNDF
jgi:hypothetical protein